MDTKALRKSLKRVAHLRGHRMTPYRWDEIFWRSECERCGEPLVIGGGGIYGIVINTKCSGKKQKRKAL